MERKDKLIAMLFASAEETLHDASVAAQAHDLQVMAHYLLELRDCVAAMLQIVEHWE